MEKMGEFSKTFWWILVDKHVHENVTYEVNFLKHFLGEFSWTFW